MINIYKHILFVTDLEDDSKQVAKKVKAIANANQNSKISVLNIVIDNIIASGYEVMPLFNYSEEQAELSTHQQKLKNFTTENGLVADDLEVVEALSTATGIIDYATENEVDLIVIGLHERRGFFENLLGNTATSVLNNTPCDLLTVVIPHQ